MGPGPGELFFVMIIVVFTVSMVYAGFRQWLKYRSEIKGVGEVTVLKEALQEAAEEREALKRRIQHLEAIAAEDELGSTYDTDLDIEATDAGRSSSSRRSGRSRTRS